LSTDVTLRRRPIANLPATRQTRSISATVYSHVSKAASAERERLPK
jgi:hypothetical protein